MKIRCRCGGIIADQTDYLPYKGYLIPDEDWFDFLDAIDRAIEKSGPTAADKEKAAMKIRYMAAELTKSMYQCAECGRLYVFDEKDELEVFDKSGHFDGKLLLASVHGDQWRRPLIGSWDDKRNGPVKGYIWCKDMKGSQSSFENWEQMKEAYDSMFLSLCEKKLLRSALLRKNGEDIHSWSMKEDDL